MTKKYHISFFFLFWSNLTPPLLPLTNKIALLKSHKLFKIRFQSRGQPKTFSQTFLNINKSWKCSNLVQEKKVEMVFCYQNCSDLLWEKIVLVTEKDFWNSRLKAENLGFAKFLRSLEQFIQTVKGLNNFW